MQTMVISDWPQTWDVLALTAAMVETPHDSTLALALRDALIEAGYRGRLSPKRTVERHRNWLIHCSQVALAQPMICHHPTRPDVVTSIRGLVGVAADRLAEITLVMGRGGPKARVIPGSYSPSPDASVGLDPEYPQRRPVITWVPTIVLIEVSAAWVLRAAERLDQAYAASGVSDPQGTSAPHA